MDSKFMRVTDKNSLAELLERSTQQPIVIFKHSTTCPISSAAYRQMEDYDGEVALVEIQRARELSREIEQQTGVGHESPQVLVLRYGRVVWYASHWQVKAGAVADAVKTNA